jgi:Flp pilus assembly protein TadB
MQTPDPRSRSALRDADRHLEPTRGVRGSAVLLQRFIVVSALALAVLSLVGLYLLMPP